MLATVVPVVCVSISIMLWAKTSRRLLYPPDLGSEGKEVVDLEKEAQEAVGLYIKRDEFPDRLFAPPKRTDFLEDGTNPIYDKEMRSEIFSQGTLMLRLVIQISMLLAIPVMAVCLYMQPQYAAWYILYVILFNILVGPVFSAGSVTQERERQTLDLLLTTLITPWQMLWGKLFSGLRVSTVLTSFLLWPVLLACLMPVGFWESLPTMGGYLLVVGLTCVTTSLTALFCSAVFRKTSISLMASYLIILTLFMGPAAINFFAQTFFQNSAGASLAEGMGIVSPVSAIFALPLSIGTEVGGQRASGNLWVFGGYVGFTAVYTVALLAALMWLFNRRWRVSD
jgi:ABC-type transport system involved in multi-copper enzyme maturation permease subunit